MALNQIKGRLLAGKPAIGTFLVSGSRAVLEVLAAAGFDFVVIDTQHFMLDFERIEQLVIAAEAAGIAPLVRVQEDVSLVGRALDCGAVGIVAPMVNSATKARDVVAAGKFAPLGNRGVCNPRVVRYGAGGVEKMVEYYNTANDKITIVVQIETREAVENLEEIAEVPGIDACFIGPFDLSHSLGTTGDFDNKAQVNYIREIFETCQRKKMPVGMMAFNAEESRNYVDQGFNFIILSGDMMMLYEVSRQERKRAVPR